ncbi:MAG TPA: hypothetical protein VFH85_07920 [Gammaproteobacteria bacterium]|nr:hypothetical protein [Gammaproteobacteria bacterium]
MENWKSMLDEALKENGEAWDDVEANTMTEAEMDKSFDSGYGGTEGEAFTVWTKNSVYFPVCYDGAERVGRVSRNPDGKPTDHQGGG